jgi:small subunit ribosomal protein S2
MDRSLGGIKTTSGLPSILFVIDPKREHIAVREANKLKIPVVALCDTNCDPTGISYVIPGNDGALKSIRLFTEAIADAAVEGRNLSRSSHGRPVISEAEASSVEVVRRGSEAADEEA